MVEIKKRNAKKKRLDRPVGIRLSILTNKRLEELADKREKKVSEIIRTAITEYLDRELPVKESV